jgi:hypothetical protein
MKAMSVGMIFGIIFAIVVIVMLLAFGSGVISDIFCMGSDAQLHKTINDLQNVVDQIYALPSGSGDFFTISLPGGSKLCFVNSTDPKTVIYPDQLKNWRPDKVYQRIIMDEEYNIWYQQCSGQSGGNINHMYIDPDSNFCASPGMSIYLQNVRGRVVIVED